MKKVFFLFILTILLLPFGCRRRCHEKDIVKKSLDPSLTDYVNVFKTGNYWVYENQSITKKDSVYVSFYERRFQSEDCTELEKLKFILVSSGNDFHTHGEDTSFYDTNGTNGLSCSYSSLFPHSVYSLYFEADSVYTGASFARTNRLNSKVLNNVIYTNDILEVYNLDDTVYLQKNVGVIGWKRNGETYNLITKYLQP